MLQYVNEIDIFIAVDSVSARRKGKENKNHSQIWRPSKE